MADHGLDGVGDLEFSCIDYDLNYYPITFDYYQITIKLRVGLAYHARIKFASRVVPDHTVLLAGELAV